jgi:hypothetical protein
MPGLYYSSDSPAKNMVQCLLSRLPPHSGSSGQPVLRGTSASAHEQTYGRRPGALSPPARAADYPGRRGSLRRRHTDARCGKAVRGPDAAEHRPGQVESTSIPNTLGLAVTCVILNSNLVVAAMCRLGIAFLRERVLNDNGPSHPGRTSHPRRRRPQVPRPVRRLLPPRPRPPPATHAHILNPSGRFDIENRRSHISTTGVEVKSTPLAPPLAHPPPQTQTQPRTLPRMCSVTRYKTTWSS